MKCFDCFSWSKKKPIKLVSDKEVPKVNNPSPIIHEPKIVVNITKNSNQYNFQSNDKPQPVDSDIKEQIDGQRSSIPHKSSLKKTSSFNLSETNFNRTSNNKDCRKCGGDLCNFEQLTETNQAVPGINSNFITDYLIIASRPSTVNISDETISFMKELNCNKK